MQNKQSACSLYSTSIDIFGRDRQTEGRTEGTGYSYIAVNEIYPHSTFVESAGGIKLKTSKSIYTLIAHVNSHDMLVLKKTLKLI